MWKSLHVSHKAVHAVFAARVHFFSEERIHRFLSYLPKIFLTSKSLRAVVIMKYYTQSNLADLHMRPEWLFSLKKKIYLQTKLL